SLWRRCRLSRRRAGLLPGLATIVRSLNDLPEPATGLRAIQPIRIHRRALDVVNLPARKMRSADLPALPLGVRRQDERAFFGTNQHAYSAHALLLLAIQLASRDLTG